MAASFDPYHQWLSIPPREQPPHHYRLLGLEPLEADPNVIESAADRQMAHVRLHQNGTHGEASQRLLNEISAAKVCLLDPQRKAAYDQRLREAAAAHLPVAKPLEPVTSPAENAPLVAKLVDEAPDPKRSTGLLVAALAAASAVALIFGASVVIYLLRGSAPTPVVAQQPSDDHQIAPTPADDSLGAANDPTIAPPVVPPAIQPNITPVVDRPPTSEALPKSNVVDEEEEVKEEAVEEHAASDDQDDDSPPSTTTTTTTDETVDQLAQADPADENHGDTEAVDEAPADDRLPLPSADVRRSKLEQIEGLFSISKAKTAAEKRNLAGNLFETAQETQEDPEARFVLFNLARELASASGDMETAFAAVAALDAEFQIDADAVNLSTFDAAAKASLPNAARQVVVERGNEFIDDLLGRDKYLEAAKLIQTLQIVARPLRDRELMNALTDRRTRGSTLYKQYQKSAAAMATLDKTPDDAAANLDAGRFYTFAKGDWQRGLPMLAKGSDKQLKELADLEMAAPTTADEQMKLADGWWKLAQSSTGVEADRQLARARVWYELAASNLTGLNKVQAQKRIESLASVTLDGGEPLGAKVARNDPPSDSPFEEVPDPDDEPVEPADPVEPEDDPAEPPLELVADDKLPKGGVLRLGSRRFTHSGGIERLMLSADGQHVVTFGANRVHQWSLKDGSSVFSEHTSRPFGGPRHDFDGERYLLVAEPVENGINTQTFRVVDLTTGKESSKFVHNNWSESSAISPGGQLVVIGNIDRTVTLVDPRTGEVVDSLAKHEASDDRPQVAFCKSGAVLSIRYGSLVRFYNIVMRSQLGKEASSVRHDGHWALTLSRDGQQAAFVKNGSSTICNTQTGELVRELKHPAEYSVFGSAFSPDKKMLAMFIFDYRIAIMDVAGGGLLKNIPTGTALIRTLEFTADGKRLVGSYGPRVLVWDVATGKELSVDPQRDLLGPAVSVAVSPDGRHVASADEKGYVTLWSHAAKWCAEKLPAEGGGNGDPTVLADFLQFSADGGRVIAGSCNLRNSINFWDVASRRPAGHLDGHAWPVMTVAYHQPSGLIASTGRDKTMRLWNDRGLQLKNIDGLAGCLDISPDGKYVAIVGSNHTHDQKSIDLYDTSTGGLVKRLEGHTERTYDVSFSPTGKQLVSSAGDKTLRIWDVASGECQHSIALTETPHLGGATEVAFAPRGEMIASTSSDGGVYLWSATGEPLATLRGHEGPVLSLAWRGDGKQLVSGGADASIMVWDVANAVPK